MTPHANSTSRPDDARSARPRRRRRMQCAQVEHQRERRPREHQRLPPRPVVAHARWAECEGGRSERSADAHLQAVARPLPGSRHRDQHLIGVSAPVRPQRAERALRGGHQHADASVVDGRAAAAIAQGERVVDDRSGRAVAHSEGVERDPVGARVPRDDALAPVGARGGGQRERGEREQAEPARNTASCARRCARGVWVAPFRQTRRGYTPPVLIRLRRWTTTGSGDASRS